MAQATQSQARQIVSNERLKFVAQALDRAATGCIVVGLFAPLTTGALTAHLGVAWFGGAASLHLIGLRVLGRLR